MPPTESFDAYHVLVQLRHLEQELDLLRSTAERFISTEQRANLEYESLFPTRTIFHITSSEHFDPTKNEYLPPQYAQDGFIHCTRGADLMLMVANKYYRTVPGEFLLLVIDVGALTAPLKYEALDPDVPFPFPHIYGPLNREAIIKTLTMKRAVDGTFLVPPFI
jgi:uncharacterized protein (DUF952 family)